MDQTAFFERLVGHAADLGFATTDTPCYDAGTGSLCSTDPKAQNRYLFFDADHLTAAGQALLADWYRATLDAASGEAARTAGRIPDALLSDADRVRDETMAARALMAGSGDRTLLFAAPFGADVRVKDAAATEMRLRQRGGLFGIQVPVGERRFAGLSVAHIDDRAGIGAASGFAVREWSATLLGGIHLGPARLTVYAGYARPTVRDFHRDTGALGVVAGGRTRAARWSFGAEVAAEQRLGPIRLQSRTGLDFTQVDVRRFAEVGADGLALRYDRQRAKQWALAIDLKASVVAAAVPDHLSVQPFVHLRDRTRLSGGSHDVRSVLVDNLADPASIRTASTSGDRLAIGGGVDVRLGRAVAIGVAYDRTIDGSERGGALSLRLAFQF